MNGVPFPVGPCVMTLVLIAALSDLRTRRIPNWLVATALCVAVPVQWMVHGGIEGMELWLGGVLTGALVFLPGYVMRMMGAGDVKLMAAIGAFCGASGAFEIGMSVCVIGGIWALFEMLRLRQMRAGLQGVAVLLMDCIASSQTVDAPQARPQRQSREDGAGTAATRIGAGSIGTLPYGVAIALGTTFTLFASV
ncbi:prepilin peptidase [Paraburkholderia sp.]|uniref:A24 family peptidase n=1 Tax=Paraburkholderia sp. TaxID=1926495 RepID=UPI002387C85B|nr:prepilin peptidase [Paraburkholderia sp.]MDE1181670.1 prepilin peptidase [Paraburkholderia sp.]